MPTRPTAGYAALTDKEKQTLRLIVRGHDAKSSARHLGLSVHTINERLRDARRKLAVSSSREAARLVLEREGGLAAGDPENHADTQIGDAATAIPASERTGPDEARSRPHLGARPMIGVAAMTLTLGLLALVAVPHNPPTPADPAPAATTMTNVSAAATDWLALVDQFRWRDSWQATGASFRKLNSAATWESLSQKVRVPLGAVTSRVLLSQDSVPAPPAGVEVVKFRTSFAGKPDTVETLSLAREAGAWRVVGYYIG